MLFPLLVHACTSCHRAFAHAVFAVCQALCPVHPSQIFSAAQASFPQGNFPDSTAHSLSFLPSISCTLTLVPDSPVRTPGRQGPSLFWSLLSLEQLSWAWLNKYLGNDCVQKSEVPRWDLIPPSPTPQPHDLRPIPIWHLLWGFSFYI